MINNQKVNRLPSDTNTTKADEFNEITQDLPDNSETKNKITSNLDEIVLAEPDNSSLKKDFERNSKEETRNDILAISSPNKNPIRQENKKSENKLANKIAVYFATFLPGILGTSGTIALFINGFIAPACACLFLTAGSLAAGAIYIKKYETLSRKSSNGKFLEFNQQIKGEAENKQQSQALLITNGENSQDNEKDSTESSKKPIQQDQEKNDKSSEDKITSAEKLSGFGIEPRSDSEGNKGEALAKSLSRSASAPARIGS